MTGLFLFIVYGVLKVDLGITDDDKGPCQRQGVVGLNLKRISQLHNFPYKSSKRSKKTRNYPGQNRQ